VVLLSRQGIRRAWARSRRPFLFSSSGSWVVFGFLPGPWQVAGLTQAIMGKALAIPSNYAWVLAGCRSHSCLVLAHLSGLYGKRLLGPSYRCDADTSEPFAPAGLAPYGLQKLWGVAALRRFDRREILVFRRGHVSCRALWRLRRDRLYQRGMHCGMF